jgi:hypothetical protein
MICQAFKMIYQAKKNIYQAFKMTSKKNRARMWVRKQCLQIFDHICSRPLSHHPYSEDKLHTKHSM